MTTTFFLVRHASHDLVNRVLVGRQDVFLPASGHVEAQRLASYFARFGVGLVQSSPRARAAQTARPIAERAGVGCETIDALDEIDLGGWTGCSFAELEDDPDWRRWNSDRLRTRAPGGETMLEVQVRLIRHLQDIRSRRPDARVVLVSHADVIKSALLYYLGVGLNGHTRIEISPAAVSTLAIGDWGGKVLGMNEKVAA